MISYLGDAVLLLALVLTSGVVGAMYRELRRQGDHRLAHQRLLAQTAETLAAIDLRMEDIASRGSDVLNGLSERVAEARLLIAEMNARELGARSRAIRSELGREAARPDALAASGRAVSKH